LYAFCLVIAVNIASGRAPVPPSQRGFTYAHGPHARYEKKIFSFYARKQLLLWARLSHRNSVRLSVRRTGGSVKNGAG